MRLRRLEDQQVEISQEMINVKQAEAEKRRTAVRFVWKMPRGVYFLIIRLSKKGRRAPGLPVLE